LTLIFETIDQNHNAKDNDVGKLPCRTQDFSLLPLIERIVSKPPLHSSLKHLMNQEMSALAGRGGRQRGAGWRCRRQFPRTLGMRRVLLAARDPLCLLHELAQRSARPPKEGQRVLFYSFDLDFVFVGAMHDGQWFDESEHDTAARSAREVVGVTH
jgi:hypothetical protein